MPRTESGDRIYAIGDVHGCYDLLRDLLDRIGEHHEALGPAAALNIVFLGDIVDRGPDSYKVLELLFDLQAQTDRIVVLLGNHEEAMLQALGGDLEMLSNWMKIGGAPTARSFGLEPLRRDEDSAEYLYHLRAVFPAPWIAWLQRLPLTARSGDYFFCHAGIRPGVPLRRQARADLLWIRDDFLDDDRAHGAVVVHGHSIEARVEIRPNRIGIDTGAYRTGELTALYLEDDRYEVLSVTRAVPPPRLTQAMKNSTGDGAL